MPAGSSVCPLTEPRPTVTWGISPKRAGKRSDRKRRVGCLAQLDQLGLASASSVPGTTSRMALKVSQMPEAVERGIVADLADGADDLQEGFSVIG